MTITRRQVLVTGGVSAGNVALQSAEIYQPDSDRWVPAAGITMARARHVAALLPSGQLLITHGYGTNWVPFWELYDLGLARDVARQPRLHSVDLLSGGHGTVRDAGGDCADARVIEAVDDLLGQQRGRGVDIAHRVGEQRIAHRSANPAHVAPAERFDQPRKLGPAGPVGGGELSHRTARSAPSAG